MIIGQEFKVLDHGFVRVVDLMGDDNSIVQAARISYGKGTKKTSEDRGLIRYLMRHRHTTPFEMCEIKLHVRVPMDCWRQWIRHRTANVNEYSTRYSEAIQTMQETAPEKWRLQSKQNKQGSKEFLTAKKGMKHSTLESELQTKAIEVYKERLDDGIAREQARKDLPLSTYTEAYWKIDLHNLLHFLALRMDSHAQFEIRQYAIAIGQVVSAWCPITWEAFQDYVFGAVRLTRLEVEMLNTISTGNLSDITRLAVSFGWLKQDDAELVRSRERVEFEKKAASLGVAVPWLST